MLNSAGEVVGTSVPLGRAFATPGRPGVDRAQLHDDAWERAGTFGDPLPAGAGPLANWVHSDLDKEIDKLRTRLRVGFAIHVVGPGPAHPLTMVAWSRITPEGTMRQHGDVRVFRASLRECLQFVHDYEDRARDEGEDAAHAWYLRERAKTEAEAAARIDEQKGIVRR